MTCCCCWPPGGRCWTTCCPPTWGHGGSTLCWWKTQSTSTKAPLPPPQHHQKKQPPPKKLQRKAIRQQKKPSYTRTATTCSNCPVEVLTIWPCCCGACWAPCGLATSTCRGAFAGGALAGKIQFCVQKLVLVEEEFLVCAKGRSALWGPYQFVHGKNLE